jgi:PEP-CTERM motif
MSRAKRLSAICVAMVALAASAPAHASQLMFDFSGPSGTALFQLNSSPTPDYVNTVLPGSDQFGFNNVAGVFDGTPGVASTINFGEGIVASLNIVANGLGFTQFSSPTLFTGSANAPTFLTGSFTLNNPFFGNGTLTISPIASAVPEPTTWAMMIVGFGLVGGAMRFRRRDADAIA